MNKDASSFRIGDLESLYKILAGTKDGLTGSEIAQILEQKGIGDSSPTATKWKRLYNALAARQNQDLKGNCVLSFIHLAMAPARYVQRTVFEDRRAQLRYCLSMVGNFVRMEILPEFRAQQL